VYLRPFRSTFGSDLCYGPQLGYTIPTSLLSAVGLSTDLANVAETGLLLILSLHLVAAALSTIIFVLSLFLHSHAVAIVTLVIAIVAAIIGSVVFAADVALVILVKDNIDSLFSGANFGVQFGNGVWMILTAVVLTWVAVVVLSARACYCCGVRRYVFERWAMGDTDVVGDLVQRCPYLIRRRSYRRSHFYRVGIDDINEWMVFVH
jgi:hypothetical protein